MEEIVENSSAGYAVDGSAAGLYEELLPEMDRSRTYEDFLVNLDEGNQGSGEDFDAEQEKETALEGKAGYYLSDTSRYKTVQADMAGIYQVILMKDMPLKGRLTNMWSVNGSSTEAERKAGVRLIYFLMSKENQQIMNVQNGQGLPLHKEIMEEYETMNTELSGIGEGLDQLEMDGQ